MRDYHARLSHDDNGTLLVTCPWLPIVATFVETEAEALGHAVDAIEHDRRRRGHS
jgi:antitoxin HicB